MIQLPEDYSSCELKLGSTKLNPVFIVFKIVLIRMYETYDARLPTT